MPLLEKFINANPVIMPVILFCSLIAVFIIIERLLHLHRAQINVPEFIRGLNNVIKRNNLVEAIAICDETPGPVAHVIRSVLVRGSQNEMDMRKAAEEASLAEMPRLEKRMKVLVTIANMCPLLGLLGTVFGMMGLFEEMQQVGQFVSTAKMAGYVWSALVTTAAGLTIGIPAYAFYNLLVGKIESVAGDMDKAANEIINILTTSDIDLDTESLKESEQQAAEA